MERRNGRRGRLPVRIVLGAVASIAVLTSGGVAVASQGDTAVKVKKAEAAHTATTDHTQQNIKIKKAEAAAHTATTGDSQWAVKVKKEEALKQLRH
jgi:hypothetical protein